MVEIEIGVLRSQCLDRRIATRKRLVSEIAAWERQRNHSGAPIKCMFTIDKPRRKMTRAYPETPRDIASQFKEPLPLCRSTSGTPIGAMLRSRAIILPGRSRPISS